MEQDKPFTLVYNPLFRVIATWLWWFIGAALTVLIILAVQGVQLASASEALAGQRAYLAVYIEIVSVGLLPVLFTLICNDELAQYGLARPALSLCEILSIPIHFRIKFTAVVSYLILIEMRCQIVYTNSVIYGKELLCLNKFC